ncbi:MAG: (Fe-S)-binding protein [Deltaproteobacteria bacterium]|nr:(Fe-S)-binding protein [Deltaproteobacteria bacterium]
MARAPGREPSLAGTLLVCGAAASVFSAPWLALASLGEGEARGVALALSGVLLAQGGGLFLLWALRAQMKMPKYPLAGLAHYGIFLGFAVLLLRTIILVGRGYDPDFNLFVLDPHAPGLQGVPGKLYNLTKDGVITLVLLGVGVFVRFRLLVKDKRFAYGWHAWAVLGVIATMMLADLLYDGAHLAHQCALRADGSVTATDAWALWGMQEGSPLGWLLAGAFLRFEASHGVLPALAELGFWTHVSLVLAFGNYLPYGKHFHVITALPNVVTRSLEHPGRLRPMAPSADALLEKMATALELPDPSAAPIGVARMAHFSWKSLLDFYTCTECGRCSDNCPAHRTGKLLSPKHLTIDLRDQLYEAQNAVLAKPEAPGEVPLLAVNLVPEVLHPDVLWACTTCRACEEQCPVMITYVDKIVDLRRNLVMVRGEFPMELAKTFQALETNGNPWNLTRMDRAEWSDGLGVALFKDKPDAEVLYWVGCAASYDDRAKKIARATARLLAHAGVDFAILGSEEGCTGDPARRAGNEHLYLTLAEANVATLNGYKPRRIVTTCPHCFNTLLNEYPDLGGRYEVVHHTQLLLGLVAEGKLRPTRRVKARVAYHDSCYLGRYNDVYDAPRDVLRAIPGVELVEAAMSREKGLCCGAGGAQMWMEEQHGAERVNKRRTLQLLETRADTIATGCPFCQTMLTDGLKALEDDLKSPVKQLDIAEVLALSVDFEEKTAGITPTPTPTHTAETAAE